eukprot:TRINITY_DN43513_c0_g1_i1.p1 TRINITY_DN43513_c0_g1~~TRINITY_DN43513_c0_g1_i1.p1  ORF type:complete len:156 (-),score=21.85 TRINITY_DN43513_c0_g1_i1:256-723(-)
MHTLRWVLGFVLLILSEARAPALASVEDIGFSEVSACNESATSNHNCQSFKELAPLTADDLTKQQVQQRRILFIAIFGGAFVTLTLLGACATWRRQRSGALLSKRILQVRASTSEQTRRVHKGFRWQCSEDAPSRLLCSSDAYLSRFAKRRCEER